MVLVRPMQPRDVAGAVEVWQDAYAAGRVAAHLPALPRDEVSFARDELRVRHLLRTDPGGAWVADDDGDGAVIGLAVAMQREGLWILSLLGVAPDRQSTGVGKLLLQRALAYGDPDGPGMILSSRDPRAIRLYARAGFTVHPAVTGWGRVRHDRLPSVTGVRRGTHDDVALADAVDRKVRGGSHGADLEQLLDAGDELLVCDGGGYAVARGGQTVVLAATDEDAATRLLVAVLRRAGVDETVEVKWLTASQQWAIRVALEAGLEIHPVGPTMLRMMASAPHPYLPNGSYG